MPQEKKPNEAGKPNEDSKAILEGLKALGEGIKSSNEAVLSALKQQGESFSSVLQQIGESSNRREGSNSGAPAFQMPSQAELEGMNRIEFMEVMNKKFEHALKEALKPISEGIDTSRRAATRAEIAAEVREIRSKHKDFDEWTEEIKAKLKSSPGLSPHDAYLLVRSSDPEKAKELDTKYNPKKDDPPLDSGANGKKPPASYGGGRPQSSGGGDEETPTGTMTQADAAQKAWEEVTAGIDLAVLGGS